MKMYLNNCARALRASRGAVFLILSFIALQLFAANAFSQGTQIKNDLKSFKDYQDIEQSEALLTQKDKDLLMQVEKELSSIIQSDRKFRPIPIHSLLFTSWEHALLKDAKSAFKSGIPTDEEILESQFGEESEELTLPQIQAVRELSLGGLMFVDIDNWTLWLNSQRITPEAIPDEIIDIKVSSEFIELLWHDKRDDLIYPVRLRPQQRFNLDVRMFLPG